MIHSSGRIEVICGSMFCGKSEELIRRSRRAVIAKQGIQVFKPSIDDRYSVLHVSSHSGQNIEALAIAKAHEILDNLAPTTTVIAVDEVQFFDTEIVSVVQQLAARGVRVILAGLDMDFRGEPFGPIPQLLSIAEEVTKLHAICVVCGEDACRTQRLVNGQPARYDDPIIMVGAQEAYEARCRQHHQVPH
ncbi:MAG: thymidine kinase [Chloroflexota bacterium]|nr:thymidine kinase [Anaerolineae bacterium]